MIIKLIAALFIFLQYVRITPTYQSLVEVLYTDGDLIATTQFIKNHGLFPTIQNYGPATVLTSVNNTFKYSSFAFSRDQNLMIEHIVHHLIQPKLSADNSQIIFLEDETREEGFRRLIQYQIMNGTCFSYDFDSSRIRLDSYIYSKNLSLLFEETGPDTKSNNIKVLSGDHMLSNGVIYILEKPVSTRPLPSFLNMTAHEIIHETDTNLIDIFNLGSFLNGVIDRMNNVSPTVKFNNSPFIQRFASVACRAIDFVNNKVYKSNRFDIQVSNDHQKTTSFSNIRHVDASEYNHDIYGKHAISQLSVTSKHQPSICPKEQLKLKYEVCLVKSTFNATSTHERKLNMSAALDALTLIQNTSIVVEKILRQLSENLEKKIMPLYFVILTKFPTLARLFKYIILGFRICRTLFSFVFHYRYISGAVSIVVFRPILLTLYLIIERNRQRETELRIRMRRNWIEAKTSGDSNQ